MNTAELEYRLIYSMIVAGKSAAFAEGVCSRLYDAPGSPFAYWRCIRRGQGIETKLREARSGNYGKLAKGISELIDAGFDLASVSARDLESIHGIGPKTSRFFIIWTRPDAKHAALDTHVLKWLRYIGHDAPKATPSGEKYEALEKIVLAEAEARGMTARDLDAKIWDWCASGKNRFGEWPTELQPIQSEATP